jgi:hypothetical protein
VKLELPGRSGAIDAFIETNERDAYGLQLLKQRNEVFQIAP